MGIMPSRGCITARATSLELRASFGLEKSNHQVSILSQAHPGEIAIALTYRARINPKIALRVSLIVFRFWISELAASGEREASSILETRAFISRFIWKASGSCEIRTCRENQTSQHPLPPSPRDDPGSS
jgi:hypothetical protein